MYIFSFKTRFSTFFKIFNIKNMAINIPYFTNNTSTTLSGAGLYGTSFNTTSLAKTKYHILGEDVEVSGYIDGTIALAVP
jgi:predicted outer membrane repeat protein